MKVDLRQILLMGASTALAMAGMGSSCPGTGSTANFSNPALLTYSPSTIYPRSWQANMIIDIGASSLTSPALDHDQNVFPSYTGTGAVSIYPSAVFHDTDAKFYALFTRGAGIPNAPTGNVNVFATQQNDMSSSGWVSGLGSFTQLDGLTGTSSFQAKTVVDGIGNATAYFSLKPSGLPAQLQLWSSRHSFGNGSWDAPVAISDTTNTYPVGGGTAALNTDVQGNTAAAVDAYGNTVVVWVQQTAAGAPNQVFFNEYRPNLGWRFNTSNPVVPWNDVTAAVPVVAQGVDVGFDSYGNGYGVYVSQPGGGVNPNFIMAARWRADKPENFPLTTVGFNGPDAGDITTVSLSGHTVYGYPRIYVGPTGAATLFWYENYGGSSAEIWWSQTGSNSSPATGTWSTPVRFDTSIGASGNLAYMHEGTQNFTMSPILASDGAVAAIGVLKTSGTNRRLYIWQTTNSGVTWRSLGVADLGGLGRDVYSANIAVNKNGDVAVAYGANDPSDFREHVYGNVYSLGGWTGVVQLDMNKVANNYVLAGGRPNYSLPNISIDELGNACAVYTVNDILFSPSRRRVLANFYR